MFTLKEQVLKSGYALLREYEPERDTEATANTIGTPLAVPWKGGLIQQLTPRREATPNTYSGIHGLGLFPFHTDLAHWSLPPRYLMLRCIFGYEGVPTLVIDGNAAFEDIDLVDILKRAVFKPRRPLDGKIKLLRLCEMTEHGYRLRWDETFLVPASKIGNVADHRIRSFIANGKPLSISLARPGDTLLIDNWRMLHARSPVSNDQLNRKIERIYLETLN